MQREKHTLRMRTSFNGTPESGSIKSAKNCVETSMASKSCYLLCTHSLISEHHSLLKNFAGSIDSLSSLSSRFELIVVLTSHIYPKLHARPYFLDFPQCLKQVGQMPLCPIKSEKKKQKNIYINFLKMRQTFTQFEYRRQRLHFHQLLLFVLLLTLV